MFRQNLAKLSAITDNQNMFKFKMSISQFCDSSDMLKRNTPGGITAQLL